MAAAIKALNAKIRSNKYLDYFCSTRELVPPGRRRRIRAGNGGAVGREEMRMPCARVRCGEMRKRKRGKKERLPEEQVHQEAHR